MSKEQRKLALRLVEHIDAWIQTNGELDVDAAAEDLAHLIPSTRAEAEEMFQDESRQFAQLRGALNLEGHRVNDVLKSAIGIVLHFNEIRRTPYNVGMLNNHDKDTGRWHNYIRQLLNNAHEYYTGGTDAS